ncbi:hypothetical protein [uncultured Clostridium sp.]|uniref:anti-sigma-I factor RsgI family protein n=1 Tax=uncultured Clostridium sp. TaxID=59620 RepID=UPI00260CCD4E|nr:hypothetical protein [uncultured Clostridium sp.]
MRKFNKNKYVFSKSAGFLSIGEGGDKKRKEQIALFRKEVYLYEVYINKLSLVKTSYEIRNVLLNISFFIIENGHILNNLYKKKRLNVSLLSSECMIKREFIHKYKEYIIFYTILFANPKYKLIQNYFRIIQLEENNKDTNLKMSEKNEEIKKGIAIKVSDRTVSILTSTGEIIRSKKEDATVGNEHEIRENKFLKKNKVKLLIAIMLITMGVAGFIKIYNGSTNSITVGTTSLIKMETNTFDKVLKVSTKTEKGKEMLTDIAINGESLDIAILEIIKYAEQNGMIPEKSILITISGEPINIKRLKKTGEYIYEKKISVDINNSGTEHKLYTIIKNQKEEENE